MQGRVRSQKRRGERDGGGGGRGEGADNRGGLGDDAQRRRFFFLPLERRGGNKRERPGLERRVRERQQRPRRPERLVRGRGRDGREAGGAGLDSPVGGRFREIGERDGPRGGGEGGGGGALLPRRRRRRRREEGPQARPRPAPRRTQSPEQRRAACRLRDDGRQRRPGQPQPQPRDEKPVAGDVGRDLFMSF